MKDSFKGDIDKAERTLLIFSWAGMISALAIIGYTLLTFP